MKKFKNFISQAGGPGRMSRGQQKQVKGGSSAFCIKCSNSGCPGTNCYRCQECK